MFLPEILRGFSHEKNKRPDRYFVGDFCPFPSGGFSAGSAQKLKEAIALYEEAVNLSGSMGKPKFDREQALAKLKQALEIFKKLKHGDWAGACLQKIADLKPGQDQQHLEQILLMQKQISDLKGQAQTC